MNFIMELFEGIHSLTGCGIKDILNETLILLNFRNGCRCDTDTECCSRNLMTFLLLLILVLFALQFDLFSNFII